MSAAFVGIDPGLTGVEVLTAVLTRKTGSAKTLDFAYGLNEVIWVLDFAASWSQPSPWAVVFVTEVPLLGGTTMSAAFVGIEVAVLTGSAKPLDFACGFTEVLDFATSWWQLFPWA
jgi:hypothetical protein